MTAAVGRIWCCRNEQNL